MLTVSSVRLATPFRSGAKPVPVRRVQGAVPRLVLRATNSTESERGSTDMTSSKEDLPLSSGDDDIRAAIRRQQQPAGGQPNIVQGALEEAQLITWPKPQKAVLDTLLVLFIVAGSGALLFGCNVALAELSEWWYHRG